MGSALFVIGRSLRDTWEDFAFLAMLNLVWVLALLLPILPLFFLRTSDAIWVFSLSLLLLAPLAVVTGGISFVANQITRGKAVGWGTFASGVRRYWAKSLVLALVNVVVLILIASNLRFYAVVLEGGWTNFALSAWLVVGVYWLLVQLFWFPMILEMESEKVFAALRFSLGLVIVTPGFTLVLALCLLLLSALCIVLTVPAVLFLAVLLSLIANHATRSRLAAVRKKPYTPGPDPA